MVHVLDTRLSTLGAAPTLRRFRRFHHIRTDRRLSNQALSTKVKLPILQGEFSDCFSVWLYEPDRRKGMLREKGGGAAVSANDDMLLHGRKHSF